MLGSQAVTPHDTIRARGLRLKCFTASSEATTLAAAPSQIPEAFTCGDRASLLKHTWQLGQALHRGLGTWVFIGVKRLGGFTRLDFDGDNFVFECTVGKGLLVALLGLECVVVAVLS